MKNGITVLSLFDGISGGQTALKKLGIEVDKYYASEIDKYAIAVTQYNYPNTIQLGDVTKWREWDIDWDSIDMVIGGFPCQAWSVAGKQMGDKDERGMLFWVMLDIMKTVLSANKKSFFMIENVKMKKEFEEYITFHTEQALGSCSKHLINSSLVSGQNRQRYYWTNIRDISMPQDRFIFLQDILEYGEVDRNKSYAIDANYFRGGNLYQYFEKKRRQLVFNTSLMAINDKSFVLRASQEAKISKSVINRFFDRHIGNVVVQDNYFRLLTTKECERLQTFPDDYTKFGDFDGKIKEISKSQRYKMLGNSWTVDVIVHIMSFVKQGD
jgi:DNA (cytosine-5)-methyltransferase 1/DNA (cytosine-5)-methyltransferase 3A